MAPTTVNLGDGSPDTLPPRYTANQLVQYIMRKLGAPIWTVELTPQQVLDSIQDALTQYSLWCPNRKFVPLALSASKHRYREGEDNGLGVVDVQFMAPTAQPGAIFYANLIDPTPVLKTGVDDLDSFFRWRKTFQRVTGIEPDWHYDESENVLLIHNPIDRYYAAASIDFPYTDTLKLPHRGGVWVRDYALAASTYTLGDILARYSGAVPGPVDNLTLDQGMRQEGATRMEKLMEQLRKMQETTPLQID